MRLLTIICFMGCATALYSQVPSAQWQALSTQEKEVMKVIVGIFDGMRASDSAAVKSYFYPQPTANTTFISPEGVREMRVLDMNNWFNAIGKPHDQVWDERIWDYEVNIEGNLAAVWVRYAFYRDQEFSHCGVDAFHLAHDGHTWRIFHLADTRQQQDCDIPQRIADGDTF